MKHVNDTIPDLQKDAKVDDGPTDPGPAPDVDPAVDDVLAGFRGRRAPVAKRRTPESAGLAGAAYDTTASPVKAHETPARNAPVVVNITEELPVMVAANPTTPMDAAPSMVVEERLARSSTTVKGAPRKASGAGAIVAALALVAVVVVIGVFALRSTDKPAAAPAPTGSAPTATATASATTIAPAASMVSPPATERSATPPASSAPPSIPAATTTARPRSVRPENTPALPSSASSRPRSDIKVDYE